MSYTSGFFDAVDLGGGNYDREYNADVFAHYFSLLVKNGVFPDPSTGMQVKASTNPDMHVTVQPGSGWINGYYITVPDDAPEVLTVPTANPSLSRIDSVIMGLNFVDREIQLYIKSGAVSASPSAVSLQRDNDLYEMELAQITVAAGVASISQANITDMRQNTSRCGIVKGTIDQIDTTDLFAQYNDAFQTWFADIQAQLSGDVATNLQNQINTLKTGKVNVSDKASTAQAQAGTDDTKWVTPLSIKTYVDKNVVPTLNSKVNTSDKASDTDIANKDDTKWVSAKQHAYVYNLQYIPSYLELVASTNDDSVAAALGKNNADIAVVGMALYSYERFKNPSISDLVSLKMIKTVDELFNSGLALGELKSAPNALALLQANSYTSGRFATIPEAPLCQACSYIAGDPSYLSITTAEKLATSMIQYKNAYTTPLNLYRSAISQIADRIESSFFGQVDKIQLFDDQGFVDLLLDVDFLGKYVDDNSETYAGYAGASTLKKSASAGPSGRAIDLNAFSGLCFALTGYSPGGYTSSSQSIGTGKYKGTLASASGQSAVSFNGLALCTSLFCRTSYTDSGTATATYIPHS